MNIQVGIQTNKENLKRKQGSFLERFQYLGNNVVHQYDNSGNAYLSVTQAKKCGNSSGCGNSVNINIPT